MLIFSNVLVVGGDSLVSWGHLSCMGKLLLGEGLRVNK